MKGKSYKSMTPPLATSSIERIYRPSKGQCGCRKANNRYQTCQCGFSLLEMVAVVAIIGVLAAIAVPRYQSYVAKSQVASAYLLLKGQQIGVEDHLLRGQAPSMMGLGYSGEHVVHAHGQWAVNPEGALRYSFGEGASPMINKGSWIELTPGNSMIGWQCITGGGLSKELIPSGCKGENAAS